MLLNFTPLLSHFGKTLNIQFKTYTHGSGFHTFIVYILSNSKERKNEPYGINTGDTTTKNNK